MSSSTLICSVVENPQAHVTVRAHGRNDLGPTPASLVDWLTARHPFGSLRSFLPFDRFYIPTADIRFYLPARVISSEHDHPS